MPFPTHTQHGLLWLTSPLLSPLRHGFSTRQGGVSPAPWDSLNLGPGRGDEAQRVRENYRRLCAALELPMDRLVLSRQVHETTVRTVTACDAGRGLDRPRDYTADALITDVPDLPAYSHGALVTYAVARERAAGDAAAAAQAGFALYQQMRRALRAHSGELDAYRIENAY